MQEILQQMFRKFYISDRLLNRYFPENCRCPVPLFHGTIFSAGRCLRKIAAATSVNTVSQLLNLSSFFLLEG